MAPPKPRSSPSTAHPPGRDTPGPGAYEVKAEKRPPRDGEAEAQGVAKAPRLRPKPELSFRPRALGGQSGPGFLHDARPLRVCLAALPLRGTWKERVRGWLPWRRARDAASAAKWGPGTKRERQEKLLQLKDPIRAAFAAARPSPASPGLLIPPEARQSGDEVKLREDGAKDAVVAQSFGQTKAVLRALLVEQELKPRNEQDISGLSKVIDSGDETELRDAIQAAREVLPEGELQRAEEALCKLVQGRELKNLRSASTGDDVTQLRIAIKEARKADVPPEKVEQAQDALNEMILAQELKALQLADKLTEAIKSGDELQLREAISDASKADVPVEEVERAQQFLQRITLRRKIDLLEKAIESKDEEQLREGISAAWKSNLPDDDAEVARATDVLGPGPWGGAQAALKEIILGKELKQLQEAVATGEECSSWMRRSLAVRLVALAGLMFAACRGATMATPSCKNAIINVEAMRFPFECESPFLFAVYHLDRYPAGTKEMAPDPRARRSKDSLGNAGRFGGGDVQWMTAGKGINHSEMFPLLNQEGENVLELFQIWINLPKRSKMVEPSFKMFWSEDLPAVHQADGTEVALIAGQLPGFNAPPAPPPDSYATDPASEVLVLTLKIPAQGSWTLPAHTGSVKGLSRNAYIHTGKVSRVSGQTITGQKRLKLQPDVETEFAAEGEPIEVLVLQGRDIGEPTVQHGPFVGNSKEDIAKAFRDYQADGFGGWPWPSDALAHPRDRPRFAHFADGRVEDGSTWPRWRGYGAKGKNDQLRAALSQARSVLSEEECPLAGTFRGAAAQEALNSLVLERKLKALRSAADSSDEEQLRAAIIEGRKENLPSAELDRAKVALDTLILAQNVQNLQEAVESEDEELLRKAILEAKQLELPEEETLRQTTLDKASKYLQNSAECQEEEQLRDAISEARKLDLPQEELEAAQQVLNELIQERQTEELRRAVLRQEESELKDAIREARRQEVPQEEIDKAQDTLSRVVSERKLGWLDNAIEDRDESELRTLLAELRKMEMSEGLRERREEALGAGQAVLAELALERELMNVARAEAISEQELMNVARAEAISEQDLREAIDQAREANVPSSKLEPATETLQQLTVQRLRADVAQVELSDDEAEIRELLQEAKVLLAPEELEGARERLATLQLLRELSEASTRTALRALLLKAEQKGLEHLTVEVARRKLAAIEELREAEQSRDLPLIETLLAQAKRLRVDPDVISAAEGVLERELGIQRFGLKHGVVIFKRDGQHLPIPFQERFRSEDIFELMIGVYRSRTLQQVAVPVGICTAWAAICAVVATRYQLAEGAWRLNQFLVTPLGLLLTFRTQQSITRFNIAVDLWSKLSSVCRSLSRAMFYQAPEKIPCDAQLSLANDLQLFPEVLREHLENRRTKLLEICRDDVSKPMALLDKIQAQIMALKQLESSERTLLLKYVEQLSDLVSPCESIVQTPVPQSYVRHTGRFLAVWLLSLPLSLASQSGWLTVAIELVASWCLFAIQEIGVRLEDPFNGQVTMHIFIQTVRKEVRQKYILLVEELVKSLDSERMDLLCESWSHRFDDLFFQVLEDEQRLATDKTRRAALAAVAESVKQYL
ncbi:unnamed protein product [Effrenium voratum]|nr:unnamed protein product [Effrenium voratum]